ncbi:16S rRNA (uracil(1498)-N(3))-methyltransferase [Helicobacter marmotae]|uniref:Ribosomal RNA small subunit methyltransferase E n=1 Tax=Helicobacter marmotae TaxID=152490 RepID=A0A3D8I377_9HELI|nr:16S rRNA (uracil(1498)-N(3))-methyltransferase [Helicobacter marmotae]RDU59610.1 16S rRNA (uracil(1498)-N(3))-methyltransferase [Helicobacter marmotae]
MQFLYHQHAGDRLLYIEKEDFTYICKARRLKEGDRLALRNLNDMYLYSYEITQMQKKGAALTLLHKVQTPCQVYNNLHLLWAVVEPKVVEKALPMLNELGIAAISFFYAQFSQGHFKLSLERMYKILIQSCQQCGRSSLMRLEVYKDFDAICSQYMPFYAFDFGGEDIREILSPVCVQTDVRIMVGPEGGFSASERAKFKQSISLGDDLILRSESACVLLASIFRVWHGSQKGLV